MYSMHNDTDEGRRRRKEDTVETVKFSHKSTNHIYILFFTMNLVEDNRTCLKINISEFHFIIVIIEKKNGEPYIHRSTKK